MFKIGRPILNLLKLILGVFSHFALNVVHKSSQLSKAFSQEGFELVPGLEDYTITFDSAFMLLPAEENTILQKACCKKHVSVAFSSSYFKIVLALLVEVIVFYI